MEIGEYFYGMTFSVVDQLSPPHPLQQSLIFSRQSLYGYVRAGLALGLGLEFVFWAIFEVSLLITLEPHLGHTKLPDFYTLS